VSERRVRSGETGPGRQWRMRVRVRGLRRGPELPALRVRLLRPDGGTVSRPGSCSGVSRSTLR